MIRVGTAGWTVPGAVADRFPAEGSALVRYSGVLNAAEINSTFYRMHRPATFVRWAESVPDDFRFAVKLPKIITHERRLVDCADLLDQFLDEVSALGPKLGPLLIQLPPRFAFAIETVAPFLERIRRRTQGLIACEPRNASWFEAEASRVLAAHKIARVAADPARVPEAAVPGGWPELIYYRLHGSPRMYASEYAPAVLDNLANQLCTAMATEAWCIFDNTLSGAAAGNALDLSERIQAARSD